jgi:hypothetical protein
MIGDRVTFRVVSFRGQTVGRTSWRIGQWCGTDNDFDRSVNSPTPTP